MSLLDLAFIVATILIGIGFWCQDVRLNRRELPECTPYELASKQKFTALNQTRRINFEVNPLKLLVMICSALLLLLLILSL